jgi:hypothetical protein
MVKTCRGSVFNSWSRHIQRFIYRAHTVRRRREDFKLCMRTNVWVVAGQELVAAITDEADRLLSLDLLPEGATVINYGQGSAFAHTQTPYTHTHWQEFHV